MLQIMCSTLQPIEYNTDLESKKRCSLQVGLHTCFREIVENNKSFQQYIVWNISINRNLSSVFLQISLHEPITDILYYLN